jgi:hypothetical protein
MVFDLQTMDEARQLFDLELRGYWSTRINFNSKMTTGVRALSETSIDILIINVVVPLLHAYGQTFGDKDRMERATDLLQSLKPEHNSIITLFTSAGIECPDAMHSQALIELRNEYCQARKCLYCRIGHRLLAAKVKP